MIILHDVTYVHPNRDVVFSGINLTINKQDKIALIGNNGAGKSTLLKLIEGSTEPTAGIIKTNSQPYYVPQHFGQFNELTVAQALKVEDKFNALSQILAGNVTDVNLEHLDDDWTIEERCRAAFAHWDLDEVDLTQKMMTLSGGQKTKVFLSGILIHNPEIILLDEPSNHLDAFSRNTLYEYIQITSDTLVVVSHDRTLLNLLTAVYELSKIGIAVYGGNYDFYVTQKAIENDALNHNLKSKEKALRKAKEIERESIERQQKLDARGKKKQEKAGLPTISMNTLKNSAEKSTSRMKGIHAEKVSTISGEVSDLRKEIPSLNKMKLDLDNSRLHRGKILVTVKGINFGYGNKLLWAEALDFRVISGERIVIKGLNGSGKTTLIKIILGQLEPSSGAIERVGVKSLYIDQDYSLINDSLTVYEQAQQFNTGAMPEHDVRIRLNRFLFTRDYWDKPCGVLSGGEKMRLMLCSLTISNQAPEIIILDEPTNNLDIQNIEILTAAVNEYEGTLLIVSHDEYFQKQINIEKVISLI